MSSLVNRKALIAKLLTNGLKLNGDGDITIYTGENSYIEPKYNFTISQSLYDKYARQGDNAEIVELDDDDGSSIFFESYAHLRMNDVDSKVAVVMSSQRLSAIKWGAMYTIDKRSVFKNEINVIPDDQCIDDKTFDKYYKEFESEGHSELSNKVIDYTLISIAMTSVVFKKTSHHYTTDSDKTYELMEDKMLGNMQIPAQRSILYRLSLHVFGIRALADVTDRLMQGKIVSSNGQVISAPPVLAYRWNSLPCGMSALSVARSILKSMEHHSWFMSFFERFGEQIIALQEYEEQASINWRQFHNNATMYGVQKHEHLMMKKDLADLAPYIIGYARVFQDTQALADSKSMVQYNVNKEYILNRFTELVKKDIKQQLELTDINELFDKMECDQMTSEQDKQKRILKKKQYLQNYVQQRNQKLRKQMKLQEKSKYGQEKNKQHDIKIEDFMLNKEEELESQGLYGLFDDPVNPNVTVNEV